MNISFLKLMQRRLNWIPSSIDPPFPFT